MTRQQFEYARQAYFLNEREILGIDRQQYLIRLKDIRRHYRVFHMVQSDPGTGFIGLDKRTDVKRNMLVLQRLDRLRMNDAGPEISQFGGVAIRNMRQLTGIGKILGIGIQHARHVFPYRHLARVYAMRQDGGRIIGALPPQRRRMTLVIPTYKALGQHPFSLLQQWQYLRAYLPNRRFPQDTGLAITAVGPDQRRRVYQFDRQSLLL